MTQLSNTLSKARKAYPHLSANGWYIKEIVKRDKCSESDKCPDILRDQYVQWLMDARGVNEKQAMEVIKLQSLQSVGDASEPPSDAFLFQDIAMTKPRPNKKSAFEQLTAKLAKYEMTMCYDTKLNNDGLPVAYGWAR